MKGLVLEGGGAKGAYQASVLKTLAEAGYTFDMVIGTSIGSINGAMFVQGETERCFELWDNVTMSTLVDIDETYVDRLTEGDIDKDVINYFWNYFKSSLKDKGISQERAQKMIDTYVDEDKVRAARADFGLVTVKWLGKVNTEPVVLFKRDIPYGKLTDYIMASATFPVFKPKVIDGVRYLDGGLHDNMAIKPLLDRGCTDILVVRTNSGEVKLDYDTGNAKIEYITPATPVNNTIGFVQSRIDKSLVTGEYDAKRFINGYMGKYYYIKKFSDEEVIRRLSMFADDKFAELCTMLRINENLSKRTIIKKAASVIREELHLERTASLSEIFLDFFELFSLKLNIERFEVYAFSEFLRVIKAVYREKNYPELRVSVRIYKLIGYKKLFEIFYVLFGEKDEKN